MPNVIIVTDVKYGDWEGIYVDGELKYEGHSLDATDALYAVDIAFDYVETYVEDYEDGQLPFLLEDVKRR